MLASELSKVLDKYPDCEVTFCFLEDNKPHEYLSTRIFENLDISEVEIHNIYGEKRIIIQGWAF